AISPASILHMATADAVICDHGIHSMLPLLFWSNLRFVAVWHGIPFRGFDPTDFKVQRRFDECWVASPLIKKLYVEKFGFEDRRVVATGYARTDTLVLRGGSETEARRVLGLPATGKVVTFAPTWKQDSRDRSV